MIPIFIGGTGRSGTSILKKVIATHPSIASIRTEMRIIVDPGGAVDLFHALTDQWSPYAGDVAVHRFGALLKRAEHTSKPIKAIAVIMHRLGISPPAYLSLGVGNFVGREAYRKSSRELLNKLTFAQERSAWIGSPPWQVPSRIRDTEYLSEAERAAQIREFFMDLFSSAARGRAVTHFVEDTPYNLLHAHDLAKLFPEMRFLHVYRDFRDVLASYNRQYWGKGNLVSIANRLRAIMERWRDVREQVPKDQLLEVRLEDVVSNKSAFLERFLDFTGAPASEQLQANLDAIDPARMHGGRWKRELSEQVMAELQPVLEPILTEYGYEL